MNWTEINIEVPSNFTDTASDIANMTVPYGIYVEDYTDLEEGAMEIAHIDLIDESLLEKDKSKAIIHVYIPEEENPEPHIAFLTERLNEAKIPFEIKLGVSDSDEWENNWRKHFKPIEVGERLLIRPIWEDAPDTDRKIINLEPGVAFGTGTHETTRLCLEALDENMKGREGAAVLDVGCGSGILAVASMLLGAKNALGVDIDPLAVKIAKENGKLNGFTEPELSFICGSLTSQVSGKYDIVLANIVADAIIELSKDVEKFLNDGAVYIVSGIIDIREDEVKKALSDFGFTVTKRRAENGWVCLECIRD